MEMTTLQQMLGLLAPATRLMLRMAVQMIYGLAHGHQRILMIPISGYH